MIEFRQINDETLDIYINNRFRGEIVLHEMRGWVFLDYDTKTYFIERELRLLQTRVEDFYAA